MKKKIWIPIAAVILLLILFVPIPTGVCKDGGTREYTALTYKIVDWNRITSGTVYDKTRLYLFPYNFRSIDSLWYNEVENAEHKLLVKVLEINGSSVLAETVYHSSLPLSLHSTRLVFSNRYLENIDVDIGSMVLLTYTGGIMESYPAQVNAVSWEPANDLRHIEFSGEWLEKTDDKKSDADMFEYIVITRIYSDCFFVKPAIPMPLEIKLNGTLSEDWCVGDQVFCKYENVYYDRETGRAEADLISIEASDWEPEPGVAYKPVIYLYPQKETEVSVELTLSGSLTCTYPEYRNGWNVTAAPDGTLTGQDGQIYNYLYWEGDIYAQYDLSEGFCIKGEDTAEFLETALNDLGLTRREANEFIVYWLPMMEKNSYNVISFQTESYTDAAQLDISPAPDTLIRVFMTWYGTDSYTELPEQTLTAPERIGFTAVEWGGSEIK